MLRRSLLALLATAACNGQIIASGGGGGAGGSGGDGGSLCAGHDDAVSTTTIALRVRNDTALTVYVPGGCDQPTYLLQPQPGDDGLYYGATDGFCLQTCVDLQTSGQIACGACAPTVYAIEPGGTLEIPWDGRGLGQDTMPTACFFDGFGSTCSRFYAADAGEYELSFAGYTECLDCMCGAEPPCFGTVAGESAVTEYAAFSYPADAVWEVVFSPCTFGCPPPGP